MSPCSAFISNAELMDKYSWRINLVAMKESVQELYLLNNKAINKHIVQYYFTVVALLNRLLIGLYDGCFLG